MTSGSDVKYIVECSNCGAKISEGGTTYGGNAQCPHKYGPIGGYKNTPVFPTDKELFWIRTIDKNKEENTTHYNKFQQDVDQLSKFKNTAISGISSMCETLRTAIDQREEQLKQSIIESFTARDELIRSNMEQLSDHKDMNQDAKENSNNLLIKCDKPETEREKMIIGICENVMKTIPDLRFIETELRCSFPTLKRIEKYIAEFGEIHTKQIDSGPTCEFVYIKKNQQIPQELQLPVLQLKKSTFTPEQKIKLTFKVIQKQEDNPDDIDIMKYFKIKVLCLDDDDDDEKKDDNDLNTSIHEEIIAFKDCQTKGSNYEVFIDHKFDAGMTVIFKIQPIFESPDETKYTSSRGEWSKEKTLEIPEKEDEKGVVFNVELDDILKKLCVADDDPMLTNFEEFKNRFLKKFNKKLQEKQYLILTVVDGDILNGKHNLMEFSGNSTHTISGKIVTIPKKLPGLVDFKGVKKKINLRNKPKDNVYDYTMEFLKQHLIERYQKHKLGGNFDLQITNGKNTQKIDTNVNEDVLKYFFKYNGVIEVKEKKNQ